MKAKVRVAFIGVGLGYPAEGSKGQGLPMLTHLLQQLSPDFDVQLYSLIRIETNRIPKGLKVRQVVSWPIPTRIKYLLLLTRLCWDHLFHSIDIINGISAFPAGRFAVNFGKLFRRPSVVHLIGSEAVHMPDVPYGDLLQPKLKRITYWVCQQATVLITMSRYQHNVVATNLPLTRRIEVLPRRIELKKFPFHRHEITYPVNFLFIGQNHPIKDPSTLFHTFAKIRQAIDARLLILGDGFDVAWIHEMLKTLSIQDDVHFEGIVNHEKLPAYFQKAHVLLHTSRYESLSAVVQEAMASGVPVCATRVGILGDIDHAVATAVLPQQFDELATATLELISDPRKYTEQQVRARAFIEEFNDEWAINQYRKLLNGLILAETQSMP